MIPWQFAALMLPLGFIVGFGLNVIVDYAELASYRRLARRHAGSCARACASIRTFQGTSKAP
jgi:hypothetical protein